VLPRGRDIYAVAERYLDMDPRLVFLILDEDFLLNKKRAMAYAERRKTRRAGWLDLNTVHGFENFLRRKCAEMQSLRHVLGKLLQSWHRY